MSDKQAKVNAEIVAQFTGEGYWKYPWVLAVRRHIRALEAERDALKAALEQYADPKNWVGHQIGQDIRDVWRSAEAGFQVAAEALAQLPGEME